MTKELRNILEIELKGCVTVAEAYHKYTELATADLRYYEAAFYALRANETTKRIEEIRKQLEDLQ